ncbi:type I inositol polyphosphate 5-phosphatase 8 [Impatiens glandulifera]|uniref:type I inositol polyphosphate 5-phosphatase 8 n=1 Tax=Impatiens glandulifera TaxID=253017 RepID=UPI001FB079E6|nr:type I inositol polyphosphate 5-phosphatase 8 [Impatiens glandulifera]
MRSERLKNSKMQSSSSWPKVVVKKWLNIKPCAEKFQSDHGPRSMSMGEKGERRKSCSDKDCYVVVPEELSEKWLMRSNDATIGRPRFETDIDTLNLKMFVGTWNVGGNSPYEGLNLEDWLKPADIYVLGFQEIVPLNAGNVLGAEDNGPAAKWLDLIRQALNSNTTTAPTSPYNYNNDTTSPSEYLWASELGRSPCKFSPRYCLAASKQMVGIFLCVWIRADLVSHVSNLRVSCVGTGIMGYLGNKGSISISMTLQQTTLCFVCTHLASGEKEGDEIRRNSDVMEILKRTTFSNSRRRVTNPPPNSILAHDMVIWLGDLNYRLQFGECGNTRELVNKNDWQALLKKDQLRLEQRQGGVFDGWKEGTIQFAPTYKYIANSDNYVTQTFTSKEKRRNPAWCDRILWRGGEGLKQMFYMRGESKFSDHRPVCSLFSIQLIMNSNNKPMLTNTLSPNEADKLILVERAQSCIKTTPRFSSSIAVIQQ